MDAQKFQNLCGLYHVQRWVTKPTYRPQTVDQHSFRVIAISRALVRAMRHAGYTVRVDTELMVLRAMDHDAEEIVTGDIPGPEKDRHKDWPHPNTFMNWELVVKVADALECYDWWIKWGAPQCPTPDMPGVGDQNRDVRKIMWYSQSWPELRGAVVMVAIEVLGMLEINARQLFGE